MNEEIPVTKLTTRLFVCLAAVAGGFFAVTNSGSAADGLSPLPTSVNTVASNHATAPEADELNSWQETRIVLGKTSNRVPPPRRRR